MSVSFSSLQLFHQKPLFSNLSQNQRATGLWRSANFVRSIAVKEGPKMVSFSKECKEALQDGIDKLADAVSLTLGHRVVKDLKYLDSHEWVKVEGNFATVGITDHAQDHLGDVVYTELPELGAPASQGDSFDVVESVKATNDIIFPFQGKCLK